MIITRRFVYIGFPKTASLWTKKAIKHAHINLFVHKTPLGELLFMLGRFFPSLRPWLNQKIQSLIFYDYSAYDISALSFKNYHLPPRRPLLKWFILFAQSLFILDKNYETLIELPRHARFSQLPKSFQELPILSAMRDPFDWHVSRYNYYIQEESQGLSDESQHIIDSMGEINDFREYCNKKMMALQNASYQGYNIWLELSKDPHNNKKDNNKNISPDNNSVPTEFLSFYEGIDKFPPAQHYGLMTLRFILMFLKDPAEVINLSPKEFASYWQDGEYKKNLPKISFINRSSVSTDLVDYMQRLKYDSRLVEDIQDIPPVNSSSQKIQQTTNGPSDQTMDYYMAHYDSKALLQNIYELEKAIFVVFPQYEDLYKRLLEKYN